MPAVARSTVERKKQGELAVWHIRTPHGEARVAEQGAQLLSYVPHDQPALVWLSPEAAYRHGEAPRGGVPVCFPWFGDLSANPPEVRAGFDIAAEAHVPKHGWVRSMDWSHADTHADPDGVTLVFRCALTPGYGGWRHGAQLTLRMRFAATVTLELGVRNDSDATMTVSQALHTYFAVSDVRAVQVDGLAGARYIDTLDSWRSKTQAGALSFSGETDRLYLDLPDTLHIVDPGWGRRIRVQSSHSRSAVLWNPWIDKARRLSQFPDAGWTDMLCIETARVWDDLLQVEPGDTVYMAVHLSTESIPG